MNHNNENDERQHQTNTQASLRETLRGKRIGALDYGLKRVGFAVCDTMHILASPRGFFANNVSESNLANGNEMEAGENAPDAPSLFVDILTAVEREQLAALIVGVPYRVDDEVTPLMVRIEDFMVALQAHLAERLPASPVLVLPVDEAFSSKRAMETMIASGTKKNKRAEKGKADAIAAAWMLREFLQELE
jgi:putative holliday junction resolvase